MCQMPFHTRNHTRIMHATIICPQLYLQYPHDSIERQQHKIITIIILPLFEIHHPTHNGKCIVTQLLMMPDNEPGCTTMQASSSSPPVMMTSTTQLMQPIAMSFKSIQLASCHLSIYEGSCNECSHSIVDGYFMCFWKVSKEGT